MSDRGTATRAALVETAERLFAERGIETVSLRDVSAAAGQRNHSAAQYHFDDRAGLVAAVFENRMRHVDERRRAQLAALEAAGRLSDPASIVGAAVDPLVTVVAETDGWYARFLARAEWDTLARQVVVELPVLSSYRRCCELLMDLMVDVPPSLRLHRIEQMGTLLIGTIAGWEGQRHRGDLFLPVGVLRTDLAATLVAVLFAPVANRDAVPATTVPEEP